MVWYLIVHKSLFGTHFISTFSITTHMRWKIRFNVIPFLAMISHSTPVVSCEKVFSNRFIRIWMGAKCIFHQILIMMKNLLVKWTPEPRMMIIKWKHSPRYRPFVREFTGHRWILLKGEWRGALMFSLIYVWTNGWVNTRDAGDLRRHRAHYDVTVIEWPHYWCIFASIGLSKE